MDKSFLTKSICAILLLFLTFSCKKDKNESPEDTSEIQKSVTLDIKSAQPGTIINARTSFALEKESGEFLIGTRKVAYSRLSDSIAVFMVPYIQSGNVKIDFSSIGIADPVDFKIDTYTPIIDPDLIKSEFVASLSESAEDPDLPELAQAFTSLKENFEAGYAKLTPEEKKEIAFIIQQSYSNAFSTMQQGKASIKAGPITLGLEEFTAPTSIDSDSHYREVVIQCGGLYVLSLSTLVLGAEMAAAPTGVTQIAGVATIGFAIYLSRQANKCKWLLKKYKKEGTAVESASMISSSLSSRLLKGSSEIFNNLIIQQQNQSAAITFEKDISYTFHVTGKFTDISNSSKSPVIKNFINTINNFASGYNKAVRIINNIKNWIVSTPDLPEFDTEIPDTGTEATGQIIAEDLQVQNISDAAISISKSGNGTNLVLKASSTSLTAEKAFTFELVYSQPALGITNRKTFNAIFNPVIEPYILSLISGNNQNGESGAKLSNPLKVKVVDKRGNALKDIKVEWNIKQGGGKLSTTQSDTNAEGIAQVEWTLGTVTNQEVEAVVKKKDGSPVSGSPVSFKATVGNPWVKMMSGTTWLRESAYLYPTSMYSATTAAQMHKANSSECTGGLTTMNVDGVEYWFIKSPQTEKVTFKSDFTASSISEACHVSNPPYTSDWGIWEVDMQGYFVNKTPRVTMLYTKLESLDQKEIVLITNGSSTGQKNYVKWSLM